MADSSPGRGGGRRPLSKALRASAAGFEARFPPARVTWLGLLVIAGNGVLFLNGLSAPSLVVLPLAAAGVDLVLQAIRFESLRFPDAALATGLFLALLLPPTVLLGEAALLAGATIAFRHAIRYRGRPVWNPAATGVVMGALLFGMAPAWWVSLGPYGEPVLLAAGVAVLLRSRAAWRIPTMFLAVYAMFSVLEHVLFGASLSPKVLLLTAVDPSVLFFGLLMVPEPRTAPSAPAAQPLYAALVAIGGVFLSLVLPSLGILVSLLAFNLLFVALRRRPAASVSPVRTPARSRRASAPRWSTLRRAGVGFTAFMILGFGAVAAGPPAHPAVLVASHPGPGGGVAANCATDNSSIDSATLASLHKALGPSVILSYSPNTALTVFYDPVNDVTVTETDLYEDYGYAEFNGDDYAVSGCSA